VVPARNILYPVTAMLSWNGPRKIDLACGGGVAVNGWVVGGVVSEEDP